MRDTTGRIQSIDITFRSVDYRLSEPHRSDGASIRPAEMDGIPCGSCDRVIRRYASAVLVPRSASLHVPCAITDGLLIPLPSDDEQPKPAPGPFARHDAANEAWTVARAGEGAGR